MLLHAILASCQIHVWFNGVCCGLRIQRASFAYRLRRLLSDRVLLGESILASSSFFASGSRRSLIMISVDQGPANDRHHKPLSQRNRLNRVRRAWYCPPPSRLAWNAVFHCGKRVPSKHAFMGLMVCIPLSTGRKMLEP